MEWVKLAIYVFSLTYIIGLCIGRFKVDRFDVVGLGISYAFFGLAWVIEGFLK